MFDDAIAIAATTIIFFIFYVVCAHTMGLSFTGIIMVTIMCKTTKNFRYCK